MSVIDTDDLDPRWEWMIVETWGGDPVRHIRGRCRHGEVVPVESVFGEVVSHLCLVCDEQLSAHYGKEDES